MLDFSSLWCTIYSVALMLEGETESQCEQRVVKAFAHLEGVSVAYMQYGGYELLVDYGQVSRCINISQALGRVIKG